MNKKGKIASNDFKWDKKAEMYVPKASPLAYTIFISERKEEIHKAQANDNGKKPLSVKQIARKVRSDWKKLDENGKKKYLQMVEIEKKRYGIQMKEMEEKGYFTLRNGSKSSDLPEPGYENVGKRRSITPEILPPKRPANKKKIIN